ncbi:MAG: transcription antitermination factor NusB [Patescibacteria group bacterium]|nr:transcription antitermination factor NusB [Patescibacteria group bacterium]
MATRHLSRIIVMQTLYEWQFNNYPKEKSFEIFERNLSEFGQDIDEPEFGRELLRGVMEKIEEIDQILCNSIKSLPYENVPLLEKSILRLATYELLKNDSSVPSRVVINEAIELSKNFGTKATAKFINGVLATVYENIFSKNKSK